MAAEPSETSAREGTVGYVNYQIALVVREINRLIDVGIELREETRSLAHLKTVRDMWSKALSDFSDRACAQRDAYTAIVQKAQRNRATFLKQTRQLYSQLSRHYEMKAILSNSNVLPISQWEIPPPLPPLVPSEPKVKPAARSKFASAIAASYRRSTQHYHARTHLTLHKARGHLASMQSILESLRLTEPDVSLGLSAVRANMEEVQGEIDDLRRRLLENPPHHIYVDVYNAYAHLVRQAMEILRDTDSGPKRTTPSLRPSELAMSRRHAGTARSSSVSNRFPMSGGKQSPNSVSAGDALSSRMDTLLNGPMQVRYSRSAINLGLGQADTATDSSLAAGSVLSASAEADLRYGLSYGGRTAPLKWSLAVKPTVIDASQHHASSEHSTGSKPGLMFTPSRVSPIAPLASGSSYAAENDACSALEGSFAPPLESMHALENEDRRSLPALDSPESSYSDNEPISNSSRSPHGAQNLVDTPETPTSPASETLGYMRKGVFRPPAIDSFAKSLHGGH